MMRSPTARSSTSLCHRLINYHSQVWRWLLLNCAYGVLFRASASLRKLFSIFSIFFSIPKLIDKIAWLIDWIISYVDMTRNGGMLNMLCVHIIERLSCVQIEHKKHSELLTENGKNPKRSHFVAFLAQPIADNSVSTTKISLHPKATTKAKKQNIARRIIKSLSVHFTGHLRLFIASFLGN